MAGGGARGGQPRREARAVEAEAKALAAARQRMAEGARRMSMSNCNEVQYGSRNGSKGAIGQQERQIS